MHVCRLALFLRIWCKKNETNKVFGWVYGFVQGPGPAPDVNVMSRPHLEIVFSISLTPKRPVFNSRRGQTTSDGHICAYGTQGCGLRTRWFRLSFPSSFGLNLGNRSMSTISPTKIRITVPLAAHCIQGHSKRALLSADFLSPSAL